MLSVIVEIQVYMLYNTSLCKKTKQFLISFLGHMYFHHKEWDKTVYEQVRCHMLL